MITLKDAILELYRENHSDTGITILGDDDKIIDLSGVTLEDNSDLAFTFNDVKQKKKEMQAEFDAQEYARNRAVSYPPIGDQLDALYHAGVFPTDMATKIKKVKDDNPKG
tara:strand:+ start:707 stop:1036 length:330 start_codon:yes stop_codon:yes gene_type:complete